MADGMMAAQPAEQPDPNGYDESKTSLRTLIQWVEDAEEATQDARKLAERDRDYYDGKQLTSSEKAALRKRGQPDVVINRIKPKIDYLSGFEASSRTDPKAFPRTPQDEHTAEAATDALRYEKDKSDLDQHFSAVWQNMLIDGYGGIELTIEEKQDGSKEIGCVHWEWDRLFHDPHSRKLDFSDARYLGGYVWMDEEEALELAETEEAKDAIRTMISESSMTHTYDDRPRWKTWVSGKTRKRVRVVQIYHRENGQWMYCVFTKGGKIASYPVPFVDPDGQSFCPLMLQSAYVDRENARYGLVRIMVDVQDEINKRRSKALHRLTMRQVLTERGAVDDIDATKAELAKADGLIEVNPGFRFELLGKSEEFAGELSLLQESKNEIEQMGPNASMQGKDGDAPSGRAILANQQSGQTEITMLLDRHRHLKKRVYRGIWDLIRQYKTEEWWVRVTDNEKNIKFVGLNRPVTVKEEFTKKLQAEGMPPEQIEQTIGKLAQDPMQSQMLAQVIRTENNPTEMFMDITIEEVPDSANVQEEQFQALIQLAPAVTFPPTVYLKASSLRNKEELLQELEAVGKDPAEAQLKQAVSNLELEKLKMEVAAIVAGIDETKAKTLKTKVEADLAQMPLGLINDPAVAGAEMAPPAPQFSNASVPPTLTGEMPMQQPPPGMTGDEMMGPT